MPALTVRAEPYKPDIDAPLIAFDQLPEMVGVVAVDRVSTTEKFIREEGLMTMAPAPPPAPVPSTKVCFTLKHPVPLAPSGIHEE